jgi:iron complex outermembrane receptor protein
LPTWSGRFAAVAVAGCGLPPYELPRFAGLWARVFLVIACGFAPIASAQTTATGTIEGRVLNTRNGEYLERARLTIEGTQLETFSDSSGQYRFSGVPAGAAKVRVFFTGLDVQSETVIVPAGAAVQRDFSLAAMQQASVTDKDTGVVKLSSFVVGTSKEMDGAAIAINEQRFASNMVSVVSADEFGHVAEGNVGEFLKFIPGISMDYGGGDARTISLGGAPSNNVPVTIGGFSLSSAASSGTSRTVELEQVSINNIARIEVYHSPTPESPGSALAGGVNMVPRGAFERSKPVLNWSTYLMFRDAEKELRKTPGPTRDETYKIHPGFDFSWVVPVNKRFGFTLSGGHSSQYTMQDYFANTWRGAGQATSAPVTVAGVLVPGALPDTTADKPYLTNYTVRDGTKLTTRDSLGATMDFKLSRNDMVSFSFQYAYFDAEFNNRTLNFAISRVLPGHFDTRTTNGDLGQGTISVNSGARQKAGTTYMPTLVWRHNGPIWKADLGASYSHSSNHYRDIDKGYFNGTNTQRTNVTVAFSEITYLRPGKITVSDGITRAPVDPYSLSSFVINTGTSDTWETADVQRGVRGNLGRDFRVRNIPIALKVGADVRNSIRDIRGTAETYTFVGKDKIRTTTPTGTVAVPGSDDGAGLVLDEIFSQRIAPWGFPRVQYPSNYDLWELYKANPDYFTRDPNTAYRNAVTRSKRASEVISSAYIRSDVSFFGGRLKLVGGVRAEQTNVDAEGFLSDPTANYRRDASGEVIPQRDANGNIIFTGTGVNRIPAPTLIEPTTIPNPAGGTALSNALAVSKLTYIDRGQHTKKEYLRYFPSLNASYNLRENLIVRGSFYQSVGRPDFAQYAGGLTLPDTELPANPNSNRITVNNAGIKAWSANTTKVRFEYYFGRVGQLSIGAYRRDFRNLFGSVVFQATPEFLELYGLDEETYGPYYVSTNFNVPGLVRMEGTEFDYKQALTFLPNWARGVQVFANMSAQRATGDETRSFNNYQPRIYNWGISLTRPKFNVRMNWNYRGRRRGTYIAESPRSIEAGTYTWQSKRLYIDLSGEYTLTRRIGIFASMRNLNDATEDTERRGPNTPEHAQLNSREDFGSLWTIGIKGSF